MASLMQPEAFLAMVSRLLSSILIFSDFVIIFSWFVISWMVRVRKLRCWHLEWMVMGIFWGSVVARMKRVFCGGFGFLVDLVYGLVLDLDNFYSVGFFFGCV